MNIWLVNPFDGLPGESLRPGRYAFLSRLLAERGHRVIWWSSNFQHTTKSFRANGEAIIQATDNLQIILLKTPRYDKNISLRRIWNHCTYAREFRAQAARFPQAPDVIVASAPPLLSATAALALAERRGARVVIDVQDAWPETFEIAFPRRLRPAARMLLRPLKLIANRVYRRADGITSVSPPGVDRALSVAPGRRRPSLVLPLGVDLRAFDKCLGQSSGGSPYERRDNAEFRIVYGGTIGRVYDIETILEAAARLLARHREMHFYIAGIGPDYQRLRDLSESRGLHNVTFTGLLAYGQYVSLLKESDICLSAYVPEAGDMFPNKLFDYLASGLPIVNSAKGEIERLIAAEGIGRQYQARNPESLADTIVDLYNNPSERLAMGRRGRQLAEDRFDMNATYPAFDSFLSLVLGQSRSEPHRGP